MDCILPKEPKQGKHTSLLTIVHGCFLLYIFFPLQVLDPRGAKFILLPRYTVATMQPLYAVRAFDYVVLTIGYVCLMSKKINVSCNFFVHNQTIKPHWIPPQGGGVFVPATDKSADGYLFFSKQVPTPK